MDGAEFFSQRFGSEGLPPGAGAGSQFEDCVFEGLSMRDTDLSRARFVGCRFFSCDLSNARLSGARLRDARFEGCKLMGVQWTQLADLVSPVFQDCHLGFCNFGGLKLKKTSFKGCVLRDADFAQADLQECEFRGADLLNARFQGTVLLKADFRAAVNYLIDPQSNKVRGARFSLPEAQGLLAGLGVIID